LQSEWDPAAAGLGPSFERELRPFLKGGRLSDREIAGTEEKLYLEYRRLCRGKKKKEV